jgi:hypothetical protein
MKNKDPVLWLACRLQRILTDASPCGVPENPAMEALLQAQRELERAQRMHRKALARRWAAAARQMARRIPLLAHSVHDASAEDFSVPPPSPVPSLTELVAELHQLEAEFAEVEIDARAGVLSVLTEPLVLEGMHLGAFSLRLDLKRLACRRGNYALAVVAQAPNVPSIDASVTHPHVRDERLCAGDATVPLARALAQGRLADAFHLVSAVLHTYNRSSAYVQLEEWEGRLCEDCGDSCLAEEAWHCEGCGRDFCGECIHGCCRCGRMRCMACLREAEEDRKLCRSCNEDEAQEEASAEPEDTAQVEAQASASPSSSPPPTPPPDSIAAPSALSLHPLPEIIHEASPYAEPFPYAEPSPVAGLDPAACIVARRQGDLAIQAAPQPPAGPLPAPAA